MDKQKVIGILREIAIRGSGDLFSRREAARRAVEMLSASSSAQAPLMFIVMDDEKRAHPTWCDDCADVRHAVRNAMFMPGALLGQHEDEIDGVTDNLIENGEHRFEGDAPFYLYRVANKVVPSEGDHTDNRAAFEAWAKTRRYDLTRCSIEAFAAYKSDATNGAWAGWLGRDAQPDAGRIADAMLAQATNQLAVRPDEHASTPAAKWREDGEADPHGARYDCERAALTLGNLTDDELANGVFMNGNAPLDVRLVVARDKDYHPAIAWLTAAKDRIRWLSRALENARASASQDQIVPASVISALDRMCHPLDKSVLSGATAEADAHSMQVIRDYVLSRRTPAGAADSMTVDFTFLYSEEESLNELTPIEVLHGKPIIGRAVVEPCQQRMLDMTLQDRYRRVALVRRQSELEDADRATTEAGDAR